MWNEQDKKREINEINTSWGKIETLRKKKFKRKRKGVRRMVR